MMSDLITRWVDAPSTLPEDAAIESVVREWPWFIPVRLMDAVRQHQYAPFSDKVLNTLKLYGGNWISSYSLLTDNGEAAERKKAMAELEAILTEEEMDEVRQSMEADNLEDEEEGDATPQTEDISTEQPLIQPLYTEDYFRYEGIDVKQEEPAPTTQEEERAAQPQTLMVVMSFAEWLNHFKTKSQKEQEEAQEKSALRSMWQREKLAAAMEDEPEEIPEEVFEMAVSSITKEDDIVSESLAQIYEKQEKWSAAAEMYRKLALKYPSKSTYFASRAEAAKKRLL
jgi:hypothetical protein